MADLQVLGGFSYSSKGPPEDVVSQNGDVFETNKQNPSKHKDEDRRR